MYKRGCKNLNNIKFKRQLFLQVVEEALRMRAVSATRFSHSDRCEAFDTSDHTDLFVRLQHRLAASVLTLSFQQSFLCLYKITSSPCSRLHLQPRSLMFFSLVPNCLNSRCVSLKAHWPPTVLRGFFDSKSSRAFSSPCSSEIWDQYPGGSIASSMPTLPIKQSCHCHGWEAGEIKHYWCINEEFFFEWIIASVKSGGYFGPLCISKPPFLKALGLDNIPL